MCIFFYIKEYFKIVQIDKIEELIYINRITMVKNLSNFTKTS